MKIASKIVLIGLVLGSVRVFADSDGAISSGGGTKLSKTENNPWWLQNTPKVVYCIDRDSAFPVSQDRLEELVRDGIARWQHAFALATDEPPETMGGKTYAQVATQQFQEQACGGETQLRFRFGKLSDEDQKHFVDPDEYIGAAIRTDYDLVHLRSKGFVYIAPLAGPGKPNSDQISSEAWTVCHNCLLKTTLWHELGHVFGIPHGDNVLMKENLGDVLTDKANVASYKADELVKGPGEALLLQRADPSNAVIAYHLMTVESCRGGYPEINSQFFDMPYPYSHCIRLQFDADHIGIGYSEDGGQSWLSAGKITWVREDRASEPLVKVYLPRSQKVFTWTERIPAYTVIPTYIYGEFSQKILVSRAKFESANGKIKSVRMMFLPWQKIDAIGSDGLSIVPNIISKF